MRAVSLLVVVLLLAGCGGRWVQTGKSDLDAQRDEFDCENVIVTKHGGWQRVEPFTAGMEMAKCMQYKGYHRQKD